MVENHDLIVMHTILHYITILHYRNNNIFPELDNNYIYCIYILNT